MLDPGLAFGTGTHPTTALCLQWLDGLDLDGKTVIDFGCGSGILAIAALKLGAARAIGIDIDPQAIQASRDNAERNGVSDRLELYLPDAQPEDLMADVVVANILAGPLRELAPLISVLPVEGGLLGLSGILASQADSVCASLRRALHARPGGGARRVVSHHRPPQVSVTVYCPLIHRPCAGGFFLPDDRPAGETKFYAIFRRSTTDRPDNAPSRQAISAKNAGECR